ncbi:hypothetical protein A2U01_0094897 [Trifolium medium]|uniref:Uncharacterized protein n=1 Tax=Trifolium medium TaxID=97028 RepID=A0A392UJ37_9FABA|nr:hypothetical protein [Trifolium medium]
MWRNAHFKLWGGLAFFYLHNAQLVLEQRAAGSGATRSVFVLGRFNLLALAQRAVGPAQRAV